MLFNIPVNTSSPTLTTIHLSQSATEHSATEGAAAAPKILADPADTAYLSAPAPVAAPAAEATATSPASSVGIITAQQSVITFAGAPAAVTLVSQVIEKVEPSWGNLKILVVVLSLIVGILIYWQSTPVNGTKKEKIIGFVFALINSFAIAAAALGISSATG